MGTLVLNVDESYFLTETKKMKIKMSSMNVNHGSLGRNPHHRRHVRYRAELNRTRLSDMTDQSAGRTDESQVKVKS